MSTKEEVLSRRIDELIKDIDILYQRIENLESIVISLSADDIEIKNRLNNLSNNINDNLMTTFVGGNCCDD